MNAPQLFDVALWLAGWTQLAILAASAQVPLRMRWKEELAKLRPLNRKLLWTYGGFVLLMIVGFGVLTLLLHNELLRGDRAALALAGLMGAFWLTRLVLDFTWLTHADWPRGRRFVVAHVVLAAGFAALAATFLGLIAWHTWMKITIGGES